MPAPNLSLEDLAGLSQYVSEALAHWPDDAASLQPELAPLTLDADWTSHPEAALRRLRQLQSVRIAWRDVTGRDDFSRTCQAITDLAEFLIRAALTVAEERIRNRFGELRDKEGRPVRLCVLALGKLGGRELNFNSDVDLMFIYRGQGQADGPRRLAARDYLSQVAREMSRLLDQVTEHGRVWPVDTRLRPFGSAGSLVWSTEAMEQYYLNEGRTWERYALIKMRAVAGDLEAGRHLATLLQPFVYRRYLDYGIFESLRELQAKIEQEARASDNEDDIKLGPGGIRALEFIVQSIQLLRGGRHAELRAPGFNAALDACRELGVLPDAEVRVLAEDYRVLRVVENRLQYVTGRQTQRLPRQDHHRDALAAMMDETDWPAFRKSLQETRNRVREEFQTRFQTEEETAPETAALWPLPPADELAGKLNQLGFPDPPDAAEALQQTASRIARQPLSKEARKRLDSMMPLLLDDLVQLDHPQAGLKDLLRLTEAIARRSAYIALLREHPPVLARLVRIFTTSGRVAQWIIQSPQLLDDLLLPGHGHLLPKIPRLQEDEEQNLYELARYRQTGFLRIALGELEKKITPDQARGRLTEVAENIIQTLLAKAIDHPETPPSLAVIGYGNLGARELHYESDLDLVFLFESGQSSPNRLVQRLISHLEAPAPGGRLYEIDTRLRPNGRAGMLVSSLDAFEQYQSGDAWTWEHQALIRARWVAGDEALGKRFEQIRRTILRRERDPDTTREELARMRQKQKQDREENRFRRVLTDIQFIAELGLLTRSASHPELADLRSTDEALLALSRHGWLPAEEAQVLSTCWKKVGHARHLAYLHRDMTTELPAGELEKAHEIHDRIFREG